MRTRHTCLTTRYNTVLFVRKYTSCLDVSHLLFLILAPNENRNTTVLNIRTGPYIKLQSHKVAVSSFSRTATILFINY